MSRPVQRELKTEPRGGGGATEGSCKLPTDYSNLHNFFQAKVGLELCLELVEGASRGLQFNLLMQQDCCQQ